MIPAPIPPNDAERVASLDNMNLLSTPRESDLDRVTRTAQKVFGTEIALVSLVDAERQWFKSRYGLDATETPRAISFCGHAISDGRTLVVTNAAEDERFHDNPLVTGGPEIRFYAGQPLTNPDGYRIGTLCVISSQVRPFSDDDREVLQDLGRMAEVVLSNRYLSETQKALLDSLVAANRDKLIDPLTGLWNRRGFDDLMEREISRARREDAPLAVAMADIDHFKRINDSFGHGVGDEAIKLAAELLTEGSRATDVVARFGGEEFVVIAPGVDADTLPLLGDKIVGMFRAKARIDTVDGKYPFTVSLGMTLAGPGDDLHPETLLETADKALYAAKEGGRDRYVISF